MDNDNVVDLDSRRRGTNIVTFPVLSIKNATIEKILNAGRQKLCFTGMSTFVTGEHFPAGNLGLVREYLTFDRSVVISQLINVELPQMGVRPATAAEMLYDYVVNHDVLWHIRLAIALGQTWRNPKDGRHYAATIQKNDKSRMVVAYSLRPDEMFGTLWHFPVVEL